MYIAETAPKRDTTNEINQKCTFPRITPSDSVPDNSSQEKSHELNIPKRVVRPPN